MRAIRLLILAAPLIGLCGCRGIALEPEPPLPRAGAATQSRTIRPVGRSELAAIVRGAPKLPVELDLGLKMRLVDFIDCTNPADLHDFLDQGTSKVVSGPAGKYRVTAPHRHAFFSYAYRTAGRDKPVLLVIEYPDDAERIISFMTHDSMRAEKPNTSFSQETGVYTGEPYPLTNRMQYFTLVAWPQDDWSPLIVLNFGRTGGAGAAGRIWVYAIDDMPPLEVDEPDPANPRKLDIFFPLAFLAERDNFGWKSPRSIEHMVDYMKWVGLNRVTMEVYANQGWGAMCTVPSWDVDDKGYLEKILKTIDAKGGVDFIAGIVADGMYGNVTSGGRKVADMKPDEARAVILKGFDEFLERYGKYKCLKGLAFGSMETIGFLDMLQKHGILAEVVTHIQKRRPDMEIVTYVGNPRLQTPYFNGVNGPTTADIIDRWETSNADWSTFLADEAAKCLKDWKHDPPDLKKVWCLNVYEQYAPDDCRLHPLYRQEPRAAIFHDLDRSQKRSDLFDTPYAAIFGTFTEGHIGLHKDVNFWYTKPWTAPEMNPSGPSAMAAWARAMGHHDRLVISAGGWSVKYYGLESQMRRFAKAFRSLPPVAMKIAGSAGQDASVTMVRADPTQGTFSRGLPLENLRAYWALHGGNRELVVSLPGAPTLDEVSQLAESLMSDRRKT